MVLKSSPINADLSVLVKGESSPFSFVFFNISMFPYCPCLMHLMD